MKKVYLLLLSILLISCSLSNTITSLSPTETPTPTQTPTPTATPVPMTDEEFSELALSTCEGLKDNLSDIADSGESFIDRYMMAAVVYQIAADNLSVISTDPAAAPLATEFLASLAQLPGLFEDYSQALEDAMADSGITYSEISYFAVTTEDNAFLVFANDEWNELMVEETLKMSFYSTKASFESSANELGVNICTSVDPIFD